MFFSVRTMTGSKWRRMTVFAPAGISRAVARGDGDENSTSPTPSMVKPCGKRAAHLEAPSPAKRPNAPADECRSYRGDLTLDKQILKAERMHATGPSACANSAWWSSHQAWAGPHYSRAPQGVGAGRSRRRRAGQAVGERRRLRADSAAVRQLAGCAEPLSCVYNCACRATAARSSSVSRPEASSW